MKICTKCKIEKDIIEFSLARKNVYRSRCKICSNEDNKIYRMNNKEKDRNSKDNWNKKNPNYYKSYFENNKEKLCEYHNNYYLDNKEEYLIKRKEYYDEHKNEIVIKNKEYYNKNKELFKIRGLKNYYKQKEKFPHRFVWRNVLRRVLMRMNTEKSDLTINMLGYSANDFKIHIERLFKENMNWDNYGQWVIHHIKYVSQFEFGTPVSVINALDNLIPLWEDEHKKIHSKKYV